MYSPSKISESLKNLKGNQLNINNDTLNETAKSFAIPKITSTPIFATPPKPLILTPRRYSLSEVATPPRGNRREFVRSLSSRNPPGPLLTSTKYNVNVSTFEDVKSPGLVNRIVQYNEEVEREKEQKKPVTHQSKYGSLGLFPVVHLFKKKLPTLEQKPRHVTVRVATPDYSRHNSEYNRRLLDGIVRPNGSTLKNINNSNHSENSTSPRSVLDALKEISRKRIHSSEELELIGENGKRIRTENDDCTDSNKRLRDHSPHLDNTSPTKQASKKICMYDEYAASRSSMDFLKKSDNAIPKRKSISISTTTENSRETKQVKLINAETQTVPEEKESKQESKSTDKDKNEKDADKPEKVETVLKVFDDAPLERIRKNRLAALMGTLVGKDPILEPKPNYSSLLQDETDSSNKDEPKVDEPKVDKPLVSILTTNKSPLKNSKHVHFNIPENNSQASKLQDRNSGEDKLENNASATPDSTSISNNESTLSVSQKSKLNSLFPNKSEISNSTSKPPTSSLNSPPKMGGFKFDLTKPTPTTLSNFSPGFSSNSISNQNSTLKSFSASGYSGDISLPPKSQPETTTPNALSPLKSTESQVPKINFSFGVTSNTPSNCTFSFGGTKNISTSSLSGNSALCTITSSANSSFSTITSTANKDLITTPSITTNFGGNLSSTAPSAATTFKPSFASVNTSAANFDAPSTTSGLTFDVFNSKVTTNSTTSSINTPTFGTTPVTNALSFGTKNTPTTNISFGNINTSSAPSFGNVNTTSVPSFGNVNTPSVPAFGNVNTTNASSFGNINTTSAPSFGVNTSSAPSFGMTNNVNAPSFGVANTTTTSSVFGTSTSITPSFGSNINSQEKANSSKGFGVVSFGVSNNSTGNPCFGTNTSNTNNSFNTTTASNAFGTTNTLNFASPATTTPSFGSFTTSNNVFGTTTTTPSSISFGANSLKSFTSQPGFGTTGNTSGAFNTSTTTGGFNAGNNFGATTTFGGSTGPVFSFGGTNTTTAGSFGTATTTSTGFSSSKSGFGTNSGSLFGNTNGPNFGVTNNTFGNNNAGTSFTDGPFGGVPTTNSSVFGTTSVTTASSFNNDTTKIFGGTTNSFGSSNSLFGSTQNTFGNTVTTTASSGTPFAFTAKTTASSGFGNATSGFSTQQFSTFGAQNKAAVFGSGSAPAFGASTTSQGFGNTDQQPQQQQQSSFGASVGTAFNKPQTASSAFGSSNNQFTFSQQQQSNTTGFGSSNQPGVFTFGSGSSDKSGGFNFNAPSTETPKKFDFTGSTAPTFGASFGNTSMPAVPTFGATAGGFSIGSGSTTNRSRPMIKGKRKT